MRTSFILIVAFFSFTAIAQNNQNVIVCGEENFSVTLRKIPLSTSYQTFVEHKTVGRGLSYVRNHNGRPHLTLNPSQCVLQVKNSNFSMSKLKMTYLLRLNDENPEIVFTESMGFGTQENLGCSISDEKFIQNLKEECLKHSSLDGFIDVNERLELDKEAIADHSLIKDFESTTGVGESSEVAGE